MLNAYPSNRRPSLGGSSWIDLADPTDAEQSAFEQAFGLRVPTREELSEIETTSRLRSERDALYMSVPLIIASQEGAWTIAPTGFVLSKNILLTVRFTRVAAFDKVAAELSAAEKLEPAEAFTQIMEEIVDHMADQLEATANDLDSASQIVFRENVSSRPSRESGLLRRLMMRTGRTSERMSHLHYTLVCLERMAKFTTDRCREWIGPEQISRLQTIASDIASLVQFVEDLISRVQLLQDAVTGIISIDQNDIVKVLTIASVVGIPPILVVGIYGMNFKYMPELDWPWGYPFALVLVAVSIALPLIWFKLKDWM
ncbi:MAG TPA: CorA family divalent cation transporter [Xanthobacteraceae bacterium]